MRVRAKPSGTAKGKVPKADWSVTLDIGKIGRVQIRPIRPQDAELYPDFARRLSIDDRRRRFLYAGPQQLTPALLAKFTQIDPAQEMAFVAIDETVKALLGVARMVIDAEGGGAEFAIVVRSDLQGQGLGTALMQQLIGYARSARLARLHGSVSAENVAMLELCRRLGFKIKDAGEANLRQVVLPLRRRAS